MVVITRLHSSTSLLDLTILPHLALPPGMPPIHHWVMSLWKLGAFPYTATTYKHTRLHFPGAHKLLSFIFLSQHEGLTHLIILCCPIEPGLIHPYGFRRLEKGLGKDSQMSLHPSCILPTRSFLDGILFLPELLVLILIIVISTSKVVVNVSIWFLSSCSAQGTGPEFLSHSNSYSNW